MTDPFALKLYSLIQNSFGGNIGNKNFQAQISGKISSCVNKALFHASGLLALLFQLTQCNNSFSDTSWLNPCTEKLFQLEENRKLLESHP